MKKLFKTIVIFMMIALLPAINKTRDLPRRMEALDVQSEQTHPVSDAESRYETIIYFERINR